MEIKRLTEEQSAEFAETPELYMGMQIGIGTLDNEEGIRFDGLEPGQTPVIIAGGQIGATFDPAYLTRSSSNLHSFENWSDNSLDEWLNKLGTFRKLVPATPNIINMVLGLVGVSPIAPLPPPLPRPAQIYGHLPFKDICTGADIFYRYEQFPSSRRIHKPNTDEVMAQTYAAPESEAPFTPTGLSAVGRFALPLLLPACWRYELKPKSGTIVHFGASVPLYGQSGGAVEVYFPNSFKNAAPIANPVILPIL